MVKIVWFIVTAVMVHASGDFENVCLKCHDKHGIPTEVLYKRYLLKYSSDIKIQNAMIDYLQNPIITKSIMPPRFLNRFGIKQKMQLSEDELKIYVGKLIKKYNIREKLTLEK